MSEAVQGQPPFYPLLAASTLPSPVRRWAAVGELERSLDATASEGGDRPTGRREWLFRALWRAGAWERRVATLDFRSATFSDLVWLEYMAHVRGWVRDTFVRDDHWDGRVIEFDSEPGAVVTGARPTAPARFPGIPALVGDDDDALDWEPPYAPHASWRGGRWRTRVVRQEGVTDFLRRHCGPSGTTGGVRDWDALDREGGRVAIALVRVSERSRHQAFEQLVTAVWGVMRRTFQSTPGGPFTPIAPLPRPPAVAAAVHERFEELVFLLGNWERETARLSPQLMRRSRGELAPFLGRTKQPDFEEPTVRRTGSVVMVDDALIELTEQLADLFMCLWENAAAGGATKPQQASALGNPEMDDVHLNKRVNDLKKKLKRHPHIRVVPGRKGRRQVAINRFDAATATEPGQDET